MQIAQTFLVILFVRLSVSEYYCFASFLREMSVIWFILINKFTFPSANSCPGNLPNHAFCEWNTCICEIDPDTQQIISLWGDSSLGSLALPHILQARHQPPFCSKLPLQGGLYINSLGRLRQCLPLGQGAAVHTVQYSKENVPSGAKAAMLTPIVREIQFLELGVPLSMKAMLCTGIICPLSITL